MKTSAAIVFLFFGILAANVRSSEESAPNLVRTNVTTAASAPSIAKSAAKAPPAKSKQSRPVFTTEQRVIVNRKATLYGINPNLLEAVVTVEIANGGGSAAMSGQEFTWMAEMTARTLRHCLDQKSNLASALTFYAVGSWDYNRIDESTLRFSRQVRRHFAELEKANPWKPQIKNINTQ